LDKRRLVKSRIPGVVIAAVERTKEQPPPVSVERAKMVSTSLFDAPAACATGTLKWSRGVTPDLIQINHLIGLTISLRGLPNVMLAMLMS
jgi:hypothetical protein